MSLHGWSETADWTDAQKDELAARLASALSKFNVKQLPAGYVMRVFGGRKVRIYPQAPDGKGPYLEIDGPSPGVWIKGIDTLGRGDRRRLTWEAERAFGLFVNEMTPDRRMSQGNPRRNPDAPTGTGL